MAQIEAQILIGSPKFGKENMMWTTVVTSSTGCWNKDVCSKIECFKVLFSEMRSTVQDYMALASSSPVL